MSQKGVSFVSVLIVLALVPAAASAHEEQETKPTVAPFHFGESPLHFGLGDFFGGETGYDTQHLAGIFSFWQRWFRQQQDATRESTTRFVPSAKEGTPNDTENETRAV